MRVILGDRLHVSAPPSWHASKGSHDQTWPWRASEVVPTAWHERQGQAQLSREARAFGGSLTLISFPEGGPRRESSKLR